MTTPGNAVTKADVIQICIRPLAKLIIAFKIANTGNEIEPEAKAFSTVTITFSQDFETFDKTDSMFVGYPLA